MVKDPFERQAKLAQKLAQGIFPLSRNHWGNRRSCSRTHFSKSLTCLTAPIRIARLHLKKAPYAGENTSTILAQTMTVLGHGIAPLIRPGIDPGRQSAAEEPYAANPESDSASKQSGARRLSPINGRASRPAISTPTSVLCQQEEELLALPVATLVSVSPDFRCCVRWPTVNSTLIQLWNSADCAEKDGFSRPKLGSRQESRPGMSTRTSGARPSASPLTGAFT